MFNLFVVMDAFESLHEDHLSRKPIFVAIYTKLCLPFQGLQASPSVRVIAEIWAPARLLTAVCLSPVAVQGLKDLVWLPIEQYRKDGRIVRGFQRGAASFGTSTAMAALELTNRMVQTIQVSFYRLPDLIQRRRVFIKQWGYFCFQKRYCGNIQN